MAAKLREKDGAYWVVIHYRGRRKWKKVGTDKREAQKVVHKINAQLALGEFQLADETVPTVEQALRGWFKDYGPTFSASFADLAETNIDRHLIPAFGKLLITEFEERHVLQFIGEKTADGAKPKPLKASTIRNILSVLRRVLALAIDDGVLQRNPCRNLGRLLAKVKRQQSDEVEHVSAWSREEVATLLDVAREHEPRFYPALLFLLSTGVRRGEVLGLKWEDVDFERCRVTIRRAIVRGASTTPKSGKSRTVAMPPDLASALLDVLGLRREQALRWRWPDVPEWVFCAEPERIEGRKLEGGGGPIDEHNFGRAWRRVRRQAQKAGVRPLKLHCTRHTYASLALASGKSVRWVAEQLGHASAELTLRVYAHALREEETDLSFLDFGGAKRHSRGTSQRRVAGIETTLSANSPEDSRNMVTRARFERATPSFGGWCSIQLSYRATGGTYWARTSDLCGVNTALYQLS
jgi:integrase